MGDTAAVGQYQLRLVYHWHDSTLPATTAYGNIYNETWTYAASGREYAIIGSTMGTHFFDVTDTSNVTMVDFVPGAAQGAIVIHRDFKSYKHYVYGVCDEGQSSLQIFDMSTLPDSVNLVYDSDALFTRVHNIFIDTAKGNLYTCSESGTNFNALGIYSLTDPENPAFLAHWNGVGHVHDAYVRNDTGYCNSGFDGLWVMDFGDPQNPQLLTNLTSYPEQGYNHSGWMSADRKAYVFCDETHGMRLKACSSDDLSNFGIESLFGSMIDTNSMVHNVIIRDSIAYCSYYHDGLWMFDISDLDSVKPIANYDTYLPPDHDSYRGAWGVNPNLPSGLITVSDMQTGLYVFAYEDTAADTTSVAPILNETGFSLSPNPCRDHFELRTTASGVVSLCDVNGHEVHFERVTAGLNTISLPSTMPGGCYTAELRTVRGRFASLLIKQ